ncbi:MAG: MFS transporter [Bacteroidaceae bacterium]|jgi:MFS family permease|nr:MFS transporter [Bacteroidaceae bacterium]SDF23047.1 Predicted arabinose efflux permease, MFS family [Bacteroidales bacterium KHT7]MBQ2056278.1 MFS transporter [Bacteroidaceae bacterium]MBQ3875581.1 MFS transporter [Bacteroidaceae bacterium]MBQ5352585.1 MFS transporter [Bacteroidaceae bacterium]
MKRFTNIFKEESCYRSFFFSLLLSAIGFGLYKGVIDNYMAEVVKIQEFDRGVTEFFRELPGLMLIFILALFYKSTAERVYKIGMFIMVVGMTMQTFISPVKWMVILAIFIYSTGEHMQLGMKNTLSLEYSREGKGGQALGYQNSIYQIGNLLGYVAVIVAFALVQSSNLFVPTFVVAAVFMLVAMLVSLRLTGESKTDKTKSRFYFRKKFTKYYMLEVFYGARKQVFFTFGPYVLILFYGADAGTVSLLFAVSAIACFVLAPMVGKIIDSVGYKSVMIADTLILVVVCFFYGYAHHLFSMQTAFIVCCVNYVLDSVISLASMASNVYVQDISDSRDEMRATISTGISVNHLITIFIALLGGWIWKVLGVETLFLISALLGLCNSAYAATIKVPSKK